MSQYEQMWEWDRLVEAWKRVRKNRGAPGADGLTVEMFEAGWELRIERLRDALFTGTYRPTELLRVHIPKGKDSTRALAIPSVSDRVVLTTIAGALTPLLDPKFSDHTYAYRPRRSMQHAIQAVARQRDRNPWVVYADITNFFDEIDHGLLVGHLTSHILDYQLLSLICDFLSVGIQESGTTAFPEHGVPQGSPLSPLLANLYLHPVDTALETKAIPFVRYADNILLFRSTKRSAEEALGILRGLLGEVRLQTHPRKTRLTSFQGGFRFLGASFLGNDTAFPNGMGRAHDADEELPRTSHRHRPVEEQVRMEDPDEDSARHIFFRTLYVQTQGSVLGRVGERLVVTKDDQTLIQAPIFKVDQVVILGRCMITPAAAQLCLRTGVPVALLSARGTYYGHMTGPGRERLELQEQQILKMRNDEYNLATAKMIVKGKLHNCRTLMMRHGRHGEGASNALEEGVEALAKAIHQADSASQMDVLNGYEGAASKRYFRTFADLIPEPFVFQRRERRPPRDPVNSLLSFAYTMLLQNVRAFLYIEGLNPLVGTLHRPRHGHPALASDLVEEFRAPIADRLILNLLGRGVLTTEHFAIAHDTDNAPCRLTEDGRRAFLREFERQMNAPITHAATGRRGTWRTCIHGQVRQYAQWVQGKVPSYRPVRIR